MENTSGIHPKGNRVLVRPDKLAETLGDTALFVPDEVLKQHQQAQCTGVFVEAGDEAWLDYRQAFAQSGERVLFAKFGGVEATGSDGEGYRVMNDVDISAVVDDDVHFDQLISREPLTGVG